MSDYVLISCVATAEQDSKNFQGSDRQEDDNQVMCYVKVIAHLREYGESRSEYVPVEGWPREHLCALNFEKLLDDGSNKKEVKTMLEKGNIPVYGEIVKEIMDCAHDMASQDSYPNDKVMYMKVVVIFFDGDLIDSDSDCDYDEMDDASEEIVE
ncbi:hypothetical protein ACFE04_030853 [Oxalis oulophora]